MVIVAAVEFSGRLHATVFGSSAVDQASTDARWAQWALLKPKLWQSPIFGHGVGISGDTIGYYYPGALSPTVDSYTLTLLADVGFRDLSFMGLLSSVFWRGLANIFSVDPNLGRLAGALGCSLIAFAVYRTGLSAQENFFPLFTFVAAIMAISAANRVRELLKLETRREGEGWGRRSKRR